jgi:hypothetical protein
VPLNANGRNACLSGGLTDVVTHVSVHDDVPSSSGSNEVTGGTYARVAVTWNAPSGGQVTNDGALSHNMPAGSDAVAFGLWSASTSGTFYGWLPIGSASYGVGTVDTAGITSDAIQSAAHGLEDDDRVLVFSTFAEALPAGLTEDTLYYVVSAATDTFEVSLTSGGSSVGITGQGELVWMSCVPESFGSAGTLVTDDAALVVDANGV